MKKFFIIISIIALFSGYGVAAQTQSIYSIPVKSGALILEEGVEDLTERYVVIQLSRNLKRHEIAELRNKGVSLLSFLYKKAWLAAIEPSAMTQDVVAHYSIAAVSAWKPEHKISPKLRQGEFEEWAVTVTGKIKLLVTFFDDVEQSELINLLNQYSSTHEVYSEPNIWAIQITPTRIKDLIEEDNIQSLEEGPAPIQPLNNLSRDRINVDQVQDIDLSTTPPTYYGLSGKGVNVAVSESVFTGHSDFGEYNSLGNLISSRFLNSYLFSGSQHGTHVAGIMGGNGWSSNGFGTPYQWRGMAPEVSLIAGGSGYEKGHRVDASNHSYIVEHGTYSSSSHDVDADIHGKMD